MADEFFADLLPLKPKVTGQTSPSLSKSDQRSTQGNHGSEVGSEKLRDNPNMVGDLLGGASSEIPEDFASGRVAPPVANHKQIEQIEAVVQKSLHRFAEALQPVLLSMTRQLDGLASKVDQISGSVHASQTGSKQNDAILEHLLSVERSLKDLKVSVESVSQRQEKAELAAKETAATTKQPVAQAEKEAPATSRETKAAAEALSPAPSLQTTPSAVLPPGPPLPAPAQPPVPATAPPATPREQPATPLAQAPAQAAQALQQFGSTASQQSFPPYAAQQQPPQQQQGQQGPQHQYAASPQPQSSYAPSVQQGYPTAHQAPQAPPTPPTYTPPPPAPQVPSQSYHSRPPQQASQQYSAAYSQPQQQQPPASLYYNSRPQESSYRPPQDSSPYSGSYGDNRQGYSNTQSGYPSVSQGAQNQRFGGGPGQSSYGPPPPHGQSAGPQFRKQQGPPTPQSMPLEQVVDDIANMGFSRHDARSVIQELQDKGQAVDLNVVLDRLMNGPRR